MMKAKHRNTYICCEFIACCLYLCRESGTEHYHFLVFLNIVCTCPVDCVIDEYREHTWMAEISMTNQVVPTFYHTCLTQKGSHSCVRSVLSCPGVATMMWGISLAIVIYCPRIFCNRDNSIESTGMDVRHVFGEACILIFNLEGKFTGYNRV